MPDRPLRLEWMSAKDLADNPANWRRHPPGQEQVMRDVLSDVGWAGAALYNETTGRLIDGHLRKKASANGADIPVLVGSWTEDQEREILATLDPIAAMAQTDTEAFQALTESLDVESENLKALFEAIGAEDGPVPGEWPALNDGPKPDIGQMTLTVSESQRETIKAALTKAKTDNALGDSDNENSNGNALAAICGAFNG